jgi:hypothetical protein
LVTRSFVTLFLLLVTLFVRLFVRSRSVPRSFGFGYYGYVPVSVVPRSFLAVIGFTYVHVAVVLFRWFVGCSFRLRSFVDSFCYVGCFRSFVVSLLFAFVFRVQLFVLRSVDFAVLRSFTVTFVTVTFALPVHTTFVARLLPLFTFTLRVVRVVLVTLFVGLRSRSFVCSLFVLVFTFRSFTFVVCSRFRSFYRSFVTFTFVRCVRLLLFLVVARCLLLRSLFVVCCWLFVAFDSFSVCCCRSRLRSLLRSTFVVTFAFVVRCSFGFGWLLLAFGCYGSFARLRLRTFHVRLFVTRWFRLFVCFRCSFVCSLRLITRYHSFPFVRCVRCAFSFVCVCVLRF